MISSVRLDGSTACMTIEAATNTEIFRVYVEKVLLPTLEPDDIVIMDNLSAHKSPQTVALIKAKGATVEFLPAYSPDLNPIEMMWSKIKNYIRSVEPRTPQELFDAIGQALSQVTPNDAIGWFSHCGYNFI